MRVSVVVPVFNEEKTLETIHKRILAIQAVDEIIYCNDGSSDNSARILKKLAEPESVKALHSSANKGKGNAIRKGVQQATGNIILLQDADLEYDPNEYPRLLAPFADKSVQIVYGARFKIKKWKAFYLPHYLANRLLTLLTNIIYGSKLNDMETGYKVFRKEVFENLQIVSDGFEFEPEFTAKALKYGYRIHEIPISFNPRNYRQGKKIKFSDAIIAVWVLIKYRLKK